MFMFLFMRSPSDVDVELESTVGGTKLLISEDFGAFIVRFMSTDEHLHVIPGDGWRLTSLRRVWLHLMYKLLGRTALLFDPHFRPRQRHLDNVKR